MLVVAKGVEPYLASPTGGRPKERLWVLSEAGLFARLVRLAAGFHFRGDAPPNVRQFKVRDNN
jgi:hypothetical protein